MARLRPLRQDEVDPETGAMLARSAQHFGEPLVSAGIRAYCPPIFAASQEISAAPRRSGLLSDQLRGLVCLRAAQIVRCPF